MSSRMILRSYLHTSSLSRIRILKKSPPSSGDEKLTEMQQEMLRKGLKNVVIDVNAETKQEEFKETSHSFTSIPDELEEMDVIRARGIMRYNKKYEPPVDVANMIKETCISSGIELCKEDWQATKLHDTKSKFKILNELGSSLEHFVTNSRLHKLKTLADIVKFYSEPVTNLTTYTQMSRDDRLPENIAIREHAPRFHPDDKHEIHGGITAFPGEGGKPLGVRNKRLVRQFDPKKGWFDYEDQSFDYAPVDKGMPWDPEIAKKMDRYVDRRFLKNSVKKI